MEVMPRAQTARQHHAFSSQPLSLRVTDKSADREPHMMRNNTCRVGRYSTNTYFVHCVVELTISEKISTDFGSTERSNCTQGTPSELQVA